ncbi:hypothetical protein Pmani_013502 [Petrolisthes manimaculis]|uniref:Uncharacterized protein n=1 Tax=Petrolisthes manimaculis TaxID=1843537 RepID=A0AAE1PY81_9EUCA|nr:hypothetical protein Pmani_013502 [Petrolisthes manimaculis]
MANHLTSILNDLTKYYIPPKLSRNRVPPWHKRVSNQLKREKSMAWTEYINSRRDLGRRSHLTLQKLYNFHAVNANHRRNVYSAQCEYEINLINQRSTKPKLFYSYIRHKKTARPSVGPLLANNQLSDDPYIMANLFVTAFASVFTTDALNNSSPHQQCHESISAVDLSTADIVTQLRSLKTDSAMGPDNIHPMSLADQLLLTYHRVTLWYDMGYAVEVIPFDFVKAFDRVHHGILVDKHMAPEAGE